MTFIKQMKVKMSEQTREKDLHKTDESQDERSNKGNELHEADESQNE